MTPPTSGRYTEDQLVEQPAIRLFEELGWESINAYHETLGPDGTLGRDNKSEVFLARRLRAAMERLNPGSPPEAVDQAVREITKPRTVMHYARANQQIHALMRDRVESPSVSRMGRRCRRGSQSSTGRTQRTTTSFSSRSCGSTPTSTTGARI